MLRRWPQLRKPKPRRRRQQHLKRNPSKNKLVRTKMSNQRKRKNPRSKLLKQSQKFKLNQFRSPLLRAKLLRKMKSPMVTQTRSQSLNQQHRNRRARKSKQTVMKAVSQRRK